MRLIDADKLRTIKSIQSGDFNSIETIQKWIGDAPTVDAVPVVRCKDCVYWQDNNNGYPHIMCRWNEDETPDADDYCSFGERSDEDDH